MDFQDLEYRVQNGLAQIRPYLQADGGDIQLVSIDSDFIVRVQLTGACNSCAMSFQTLKAGVEYTIRKNAPEIKSVEAVEI